MTSDFPCPSTRPAAAVFFPASQSGKNRQLDRHLIRDYNVPTMRARIIKIGNSQGIRIPKLFLEQTRLGEEVELEAQDDQIVIRPISYPRQGWDEAFQAMAERGDDQLPDGNLIGQTRWDQEEWEW